MCTLDRPEHGAALMSSTESTSRCCQWWHSKSCPSCLPSQLNNPSSILRDSWYSWCRRVASSSPWIPVDQHTCPNLDVFCCCCCYNDNKCTTVFQGLQHEFSSPQFSPGYAGRTELPDNLKSMFRPISMVVPDSTLIAEIILFGEGFNNCKVLRLEYLAL